MIPRNAIPIGHVTPRPPIEINPRRAITMDQRAWRPGDYQPCGPAECQRLWALVKGAAEGSNVADVPRPEVDTTGWEAA